MKISYKSQNPNAGVVNYEMTDVAIILEFSNAKYRYVYNEQAPGLAHVEAMKRLALAGQGLTTYINQHVREHYASKVLLDQKMARRKS